MTRGAPVRRYKRYAGGGLSWHQMHAQCQTDLGPTGSLAIANTYEEWQQLYFAMRSTTTTAPVNGNCVRIGYAYVQTASGMAWAWVGGLTGYGWP